MGCDRLVTHPLANLLTRIPQITKLLLLKIFWRLLRWWKLNERKIFCTRLIFATWPSGKILNMRAFLMRKKTHKKFPIYSTNASVHGMAKCNAIPLFTTFCPPNWAFSRWKFMCEKEKMLKKDCSWVLSWLEGTLASISANARQNNSIYTLGLGLVAYLATSC